MDQGKKSPRILEISWGTSRLNGIQPADAEELLAHGASTVVLSQGIDKQLQVDPATMEYLEQRSITVHVAETRQAVEIYNKLAEHAPVGGLFHSTC